jgi:glycosyltransferase involved in cell wall biosynthesis
VSDRPRVLFVGRTRFAFPLPETLTVRFEALSAELDWVQFGTARGGGAPGDPRFALVRPFPVARLDGIAFHLLLPLRVARLLRRGRPDVVIVQGAHETALVLLARRLARVPTRVVFDVHGDWRTATRLYGSPARRLLSLLADALARVALRRADGIRTVSGFTTRLVREMGREPDATFPAYMDLAPFTASAPAPLPDRPLALFVGVLERYKGIDALAAAWPRVLERVPDARLRIVGRGRMQPEVEALVAGFPGSVSWEQELPTAGVAAALDAATLLVLPSRTEGMGRVVVEAFCRGRPVVGSDDGGIADLVDASSGLLVPPGDPGRLADALVAVLGDPATAARLGNGAHAARAAWLATPAEFAARFRDLVDRVARRP